MINGYRYVLLKESLDGQIRSDMNTEPRSFGKVLVLAAHPDDETIACSALLQRATASLVVFAVDGAPPHFEFEKTFGSLRKYSDARFQEASQALTLIPNCSFRRLARKDSNWFVDQHLFLDLQEAFSSFIEIIEEFSPDVLVSHAFEGGHIDHDACHVLASRAAFSLGLRGLEFPLYWRSARGEDVFQEFRKYREGEFSLQLLQQELFVKQQMLAEYRTQKTLTLVFRPETEPFRPMTQIGYATPAWPDYPFENRHGPLRTERFLRRIAEFNDASSTSTTDRQLKNHGLEAGWEEVSELTRPWPSFTLRRRWRADWRAF